MLMSVKVYSKVQGSNQVGGAHTVVSVHIVKLLMALAAAHASVSLLLISVMHFSTGAPAVLPHVSLNAPEEGSRGFSTLVPS